MTKNSKPKNTAPENQEAEEEGQKIGIRSFKDGYRRCGIAHPAAVVVHPLSKFTEEELEILCSDPNLSVRLSD